MTIAWLLSEFGPWLLGAGGILAAWFGLQSWGASKERAKQRERQAEARARAVEKHGKLVRDIDRRDEHEVDAKLAKWKRR